MHSMEEKEFLRRLAEDQRAKSPENQTLESPWSCPRCGRSDLTLKCANAHVPCMSKTNLEEDLWNENFALEREIDKLRAELAAAHEAARNLERSTNA